MSTSSSGYRIIIITPLALKVGINHMDIAKQIDVFEALKERINPETEPGFSLAIVQHGEVEYMLNHCLLYTSPSPRDRG